MDGSRKAEPEVTFGRSSDDDIGASEADPTGKVLQQARDSTGGVRGRGLEAHS